MVITPQTNIRLLKTPFQLDNKNQLTFASKQAQTSYFLNLPYIDEDNCTYQRKDNVIRFPEHIDNIITYNYVMYQNENYSNKWFYAFITDMKYINDNLTEISIKTDVFQSWQFDIIYKKMFIEREHVNDDTVGLHTVPENLETGEFICNEHYKDTTMDNYANDLCFILASTSEPISGEAKDTVAGSGIYNGIYTGLKYYEYETTSAIDVMLDIFANSGKTEAINGVFMAPKWLAPLSQSLYREVEQSNAPSSFNINVSKQTTLDSYTPINNKLKCFPFNYLLVSNNIGQNSIIHYEKFSDYSNATFTVKGVLNPGCSINITPTNYNGCASNDNESIQLGKFPICNFQNDMYTNWLTQNSINILGNSVSTDDLSLISSGVGSISGLATNIAVGNYLGAGMSAISGFQNISNSVIQQKQHNMIPPTVNGQLNSADINVASGNNTFHFYKMTIRQEYAKIIDNFFNTYGYKVNDFKIPNITGRTNWNYVKTINANILGNIPQQDMQELKNILDNGVTFWHNPSTFLDYSQSNNIV